MTLRILACALLAVCCLPAADSVAARLAREARQAEASGQVVRAYLLYAEAAAREPENPSYRANRDALAPAAKLLTKAEIQDSQIAQDIEAAQNQIPGAEPPVEFATLRDWQQDETLQPLPQLQPKSSPETFDTRGDEKFLFQQVASAYGIRPVFDPQFDSHPNVRFNIDRADFRTAMEALTAVTQTFMFPISQHDIFVVRDTETKRNEFEPHVLLTFPLPDAVDQKELIEAASAVRGVLGLRAIGWDSTNRVVLIRDRYTRARVARSILETLLLPRAQVSIEVQFLTFDSDRTYHYGASLQTAYQLIYFGHLGGLKTILPNLLSPNYLALGGGATLFGLGLTNATVFAQYSNSVSHNLFDATVVVSEGQTANFHIGDKYPIPQTLYSGFQQGAPSIYNPVGQITLEDLGLILKMTPRVKGDGGISLDLEADFKTLGTQTFNTVPAIAERGYKGTIALEEGEWAVLAGMDSSTYSKTRNGIAGLSQIPALNELLSENMRETQTSNTLILIKPTITRLPMSASISPQYLLGPARGERVLL